MNTALEPDVISPGRHPITESQIDQDALFVLRRLNDSGFAAYLVGGGVRDLYLGKTPKDFDISTNAKPGQLRKLFPNSRTIGRRFRLVQVFFGRGKVVEVSTLRSLSEYDLDGPELVLAPNNTYGTLDQDAQRRDLTINSLFFEINNHSILDYVGGVQDLEAGIIRIVGDPERRIHRDPVRMLRAIRHASRNDFVIEKKSWEAICNLQHTLTLCPPSRLRDELLKDLYSGASAKWFEPAELSGLFLQLLPIYDDILHNSDDKTRIKQELINIFSTIDRTNTFLVTENHSRPKDFFIFAFLLLPWAQHTFKLLSDRATGEKRTLLTKQLRNAIDEQLGYHLNLRKSLRMEIVTLLINLPSLLHHKRKGNWPKWLKRKSYFHKSVLFYHFYKEAYENKNISDTLLKVKSRAKDNHTNRGKNNRPHSHRKKRGYTRKKH